MGEEIGEYSKKIKVNAKRVQNNQLLKSNREEKGGPYLLGVNYYPRGPMWKRIHPD